MKKLVSLGRVLSVFCYVLAVCLIALPSMADELLGEIGIEDILIQPTFTVYEPQQGEFSLNVSSFSLYWFKNSNLSARVRVGKKALMWRPARFVGGDENELGFYEAYAQYQGGYGRIRFGLIPLDYGVEGSWGAGKLIFPRSLLFTEGVVGMRDLGMSYAVENKGYYTRMVVHNGEAGENTDGRIYYTAAWGWKNHRNTEVGLAGQTGETKPESTALSSDTLAGVDVNKESHWRMGQFYFHWYPNRWNILFQANWGELEQEGHEAKFVGANIDLSYRYESGFGLQARYDEFDPNDRQEGDLLREITGGISFASSHQNSVLFFLATKVLEETVETSNDRYMVMWRLTPKAQ